MVMHGIAFALAVTVVLGGMLGDPSDLKRCPDGGKHCFPSVQAAKRARRTVGNRFRVYRCEVCHYFHITRRA